MIISNLKPDQNDKRLHNMIRKMIAVAKYHPKEKYIYPIMEGVPFKDLQVALDMAITEHEKTNDNSKS